MIVVAGAVGVRLGKRTVAIEAALAMARTSRAVAGCVHYRV